MGFFQSSQNGLSKERGNSKILNQSDFELGSEADRFGENVHIRGDVKIENELKLDGVIEGDLHVTGTLVIGPKGVVIGDVNVKSVRVFGSIRGQLYAGNRVVLDKGSVIVGNVFSASLAVDGSAVLQGEIHLSSPTEALRLARSAGSESVNGSDGVAEKRQNRNPDNVRSTDSGSKQPEPVTEEPEKTPRETTSNIFPLRPSEKSNHFY